MTAFIPSHFMRSLVKEVPMFQISRVDHTALRTDDMEATVQFYCGVLGLPLLQTMRGSGASRRYVFGAGDRNRLVFFDGHARSEEGAPQHLDHIAIHVDTVEEFDEAYRRLQDHGVATTDIIERAYGKTFYFHDPNGIYIQIGLDTQPDPRVADDPDPVPSASKYLVQS
jgi:catechol 2,3-dioxygenase-like lactoylglutathione lyase family enzyme